MTILAIDFGGTQVKSALVSEQFAIERICRRSHPHKPWNKLLT